MRVSAALASVLIDGFAWVAADKAGIENGPQPARPPANRAARIATWRNFTEFLQYWDALGRCEGGQPS